MTLIIILFIVVAIIAIALRWASSTPSKHRNKSQDTIINCLKFLLRRGYNGGFLVIEIPKDDKFIQFNKYIINNQIGITLDFPLAPWSKNYYDETKIMFKNQNIKYELQKINEEGDSKISVKEFLVVDFKDDIELAFKIAKCILNDIFEYPNEKKITYYYWNVSFRDELIK